MQRHTIDQSTCFVPWPTNGRTAGNGAIRIRLFQRVVAPWTQPTAVWEFGPLTGSVEGLDISLWRFDLRSMRLRSSQGTCLAHTFSEAKNLDFSERMVLEVSSSTVGGAGWSQFEVDLFVPPDELDGMKRRLRLSRVPPIEWFFVELTNRCNFRCAWCPSVKMARGRGAMPLARAKVLMEEIAAYRRRHPLFSLYAQIQNPVFLHVMGEPLLHPDFFEIVRHGQDLGLNFCLVTNASLIKGEMVRRLLESNLNSIVLSLNAPDEASFSQARAPLSYGRLVAQVQELVRERYRRGSTLPRLELQLINSKRVRWSAFPLVDEPEQVARQLVFWSDFVQSLEKASGVISCGLEPAEAARWQTVLERETNDRGIYFELGLNLSLTFKLACNFGNELLPDHLKVLETSSGVCHFRNAYRTFCVFWDGSCTFCSLDYDNEVNLGNVFEQGIDAIWTGESLTRIRGLAEHGVLAEPLCRRCMGTLVPSRVAREPSVPKGDIHG